MTNYNSLMMKFVLQVLSGRGTAETVLITVMCFLIPFVIGAPTPYMGLVVCSLIFILGLLYIFIYKAKTEREKQIVNIKNLSETMNSLRKNLDGQFKENENLVKHLKSEFTILQNRNELTEKAMKAMANKIKEFSNFKLFRNDEVKENVSHRSYDIDRNK